MQYFILPSEYKQHDLMNENYLLGEQSFKVFWAGSGFNRFQRIIQEAPDVLEHIEPQLIDNVIDHLISKFRKKAFLAIDMKESKKSLPSGRNAHLIIEDVHYWIKKFSGHCNIKTVNNDHILYLELTKSKE